LHCNGSSNSSKYYFIAWIP